jgi:predicted MPP superfamily phosphohydrolase
MKIVALGDTHGRDIWKTIIKIENDFDKFVFIGDYFDTRDDINASIQIQNFKEILEFKKENPDKVVLLIGNHDFHYLKGCGETYSGYQQYAAMDINEVLQPALTSEHLQICYVYDDLIFSHAGLTNTWCETNEIDLYNIENSVNTTFMKKMEAFRFEYGENLDRSGNDVTQSPIWVRIPSLLKDMVKGFTYIIGHTTIKELHMANNIIAIDCLGTSKEYLVIKDGEAFAKKIIIKDEQ